MFGALGPYSGCLGENMNKTPSAARVEMIRSLVGVPTVSRDSNLKLIEFGRAIRSRSSKRTAGSTAAALRT